MGAMDLRRCVLFALAAHHILISSAFHPVLHPRAFRALPTTLPARLGGPSPLDPQDGGLARSDQDQEEKEYRAKLAEAEEAIAAAEAARRNLQKSRGPPPSSRATISYSDAGTLVLTVPPSGVQTDSVFSGAFSLAWFSAIVPATFASGGVAPLLFMLPFWAAGGLVAKSAVYDPFVGSDLTIGRYAWSLRRSYAGQTVKERDGPTEELRGAASEVAVVVNEIPKGEVRLYGEKGVVPFGLGLGMDELEYLAGVINDHLRKVKETPLDEDIT